MADRSIHYFARGNTAQGLSSLADSVLQGLSVIYVLQGYPGGTEKALADLAEICSQNDSKLHFIHQALDSDLLEGIIIEDFSVAVIDGEIWSEELQSNRNAEIHYIDLSSASLDTQKLTEADTRIKELEKEIKGLYCKAYETFHKTLLIHDDWEKLYIDNLDRDRMNQLAIEWSDKYLQRTSGEQDQQGSEIHRFLGAATCKGAVDFIPSLTDGLQHRVFVKGRPGSGKSTLFKKLAASAIENGIDTEIYHCGFDSNSLDMLIFRGLSLAIFDSTAPHEHDPSRDGDVILDVYDLAITEGTDEKYAEEIAIVKERYSQSMRESISYLAQVKELRDELKAIYTEAADTSLLSEWLTEV
ncbi:hypothetical protein D3C78_834180 [compost metagenome]